MKRLCLLLFTLYAIVGSGQSIDYAPHSISLNIFSIFSPYHFNFNVSYERRFSDRLAIEIGLAPIMPGDYSSSVEGSSRNSGFILRVEPKYFISNRQEIDTTRSVFVSTQFFASFHKYKLKVIPNYKKADNIIHANIKNYAFGMVGHFGYHETGGQTFAEFSTGYGKQWIFTRNDNFQELKNTRLEDSFFLHITPEWTTKPIIGLNGKLGVNF